MTEDTALESFLDGICRTLSADGAAFTRAVHDDANGEGALDVLVLDPAVGMARLRMPARGVHCETVLTTGDTLAVARGAAAESAASSYMRAEGIEAYLGAPVRDGAGRVTGVLAVMSRTPRDWPEEARREVEAAAGFLGVTLDIGA